MTRSILKLSVVTTTMTVVLSLAGYYQVQQKRLHEATRLRTENDQLRLRFSQQLQIHFNNAGASKLPTDLNVDSSPDRRGRSAAELRLPAPTTEIAHVPGTDYRNEGQATPIAALQTYAWACDRGDTTTVLQLIHFDEGARRKTVAYMSALPTELRTQWDSPEAMAAPLLIHQGIQGPYPGAAILALAKIEIISEARVALLLPGTNQERNEFQKTSDGWKYAITEKMVDEYIAEHPIAAHETR